VTARVHLRAKADRLHLRWDRQSDESSEGESSEITETVSLVHFANHFGGGYTLFVCPGLQGAAQGDTQAPDAGPEVGSGDDSNGDAGPGAGSCGRRVVRLYLARGRFLCRQCSQLVHVTPYELPWQRALRRANKLRRRLGVGPGVSTALVAPPKPRFITVDRYKYLLDKLLWAEIAVTEAQAAYFLQLAERIERRSRRRELKHEIKSDKKRAGIHEARTARLQQLVARLERHKHAVIPSIKRDRYFEGAACR
jgi:hypothetical protein